MSDVRVQQLYIVYLLINTPYARAVIDPSALASHTGDDDVQIKPMCWLQLGNWVSSYCSRYTDELMFAISYCILYEIISFQMI